MAAAHVYHWKHGWIPLDHAAAMSKAKGNKAKAAEYLHEAPHAEGIQSRQDVARALLDLPSITDINHRASAMREIEAAADRLGAKDLLLQPSPKPKRNTRPPVPQTNADVAIARGSGNKAALAEQARIDRKKIA
ncbi:MAG TPA: hypothetical protein VFF59_02640, partial [Anaerolineae bacterium]|nr:hypothetical protein [Anaerolineae bacterium]